MPLLLRKCAPSVSIEQLALKAPPPSLKSLARNMTCSMKKSSSGNTISSTRRSTTSTLSLSESLSDGEESHGSSGVPEIQLAPSSMGLSGCKGNVENDQNTMANVEDETSWNDADLTKEDEAEEEEEEKHGHVDQTVSEAVENVDECVSEVESVYGVSINPEVLEENVIAAVEKELVCPKRGFIRRLYTCFRRYAQLKRTLRSIRQEGVISSNSGSTNHYL